MKINKSVVWTLILLTVVAALYRIIPNRPWGFAPQWAIAVFAGAVIKDKKLAFIVPVLSMFISDALYQILYMNGMSSIQGFYEGQWQNYLLFAVLAVFGMMMKKINVRNVLLASLAAPTFYFLLSNFILWAGTSGTRGFNRPKTFNGLMLCYTDALPFYGMSILSTILFCGILFGTYYFVNRKQSLLATA